jgi:Ca2+-binding RTX toxin-like protein
MMVTIPVPTDVYSLEGIQVIQQSLESLAAAYGGAYTTVHGAMGSVPPATPGVLNIGVLGAYNSDDAVPAGYQAIFLENGAPVTLTDGTTGSGGALLAGGSGDQEVADNSPGGNDTIVAGSGNQWLFGGVGPNAELVGGSGSDVLAASTQGAGGAYMLGGPGNTTFYDGPGSSTIITGNGDNTVYASSGSDQITTGTGSNYVSLGLGNSQVLSQGSDTIVGGSGSATVFATGRNLTYGGSGPMFFINGSQSSTVIGGSGTGNDVINAGAGGGLFAGGQGATNIIFAGAGAATMFGGSGSDVMFAGGNAADLLIAGSGNETLSGLGSAGNNTLYAGSGSDLLGGGAGNETFIGGTGYSTMIGGSGADLYGFINGLSSGGSDLIYGFDPFKGDAIGLQGYTSGEAASALANAFTSGGNETLLLSDNTQITLVGVTGLNLSNFV